MMTEAAHDAVKAAFAAFLQAIQAGDTDRLRQLVDGGFTLTHITGYVQPGQEWLTQMRQGQFVYHRITVSALGVNVAGDAATAEARTLTDARVYGSRNEWPLHLALDYALRDGRWIAGRAVASLWR